MKYMVIVLVILIGVPWAVAAGKGNRKTDDPVGQIPVFVVTAERFEDDVMIGRLDTVVVAARRVPVYGAGTADNTPAGEDKLSGTLVFLGLTLIVGFLWLLYHRHLNRRSAPECPHCT